MHLPSSVQKFEIIGRQYDGSGLTEYEIDKNNKHYFVEDDLVYSARTNWSQGTMSVATLERMLKECQLY